MTTAPVLALASPASLKGVLSAREAVEALAAGFARAGGETDEAPIADGGEGTAEVLGARVVGSCRVHDAFGRERDAPLWGLEDGTVVVESADAIPLEPSRLGVLEASSRGLGELIAEVGVCRRLLVCLGGTATMDGGSGLLDLLAELPAPTTVLCDTRARLLQAPRAFGPQKGASEDDVARLEDRLARLPHARPYGELPGSGAAGGLGSALALLGADLVSGAEYVLDAIGFRQRADAADLVVTGEGVVDATTFEGKAPGEAVRVCRELGVRCILFGGRVAEGLEARALSGDPARAREDLEELALGLGRFGLA